MFPQFKKLNNESGIVLFIVLMVAIIVMIFSIGILTQSVNEINYAQQQIDQIAADELAKGMWWNMYNASANSLQNTSTYQVENGRNYQINMVNGITAGGYTSYNVLTSYDSFQ